MRIWHNHQPVGDIVEYIDGKMFGVVTYPEGEKRELGKNHRWLATMMTEEDVHEYLDWCWRECDRVIYNAWVKKPEDKEWLPGDEFNEEDEED